MRIYSGLLLLSFILFHSAVAQVHQIKFDRYVVEDGVSQSNILCIYQDTEGFLWFGTQDGLNKFNGYSFEKYYNDPNDTASISNGWIYSISEDVQKNIWIGTREGLNKFDKSTSRFTRYNVKPGDKNSISDNKIYGVSYYKGLVIINTPPVLNILNVETGEINQYKNSLDYEKDDGALEKGLPIIVDKMGNIWISTTKGLSRFSQTEKTFKNYFHSSNDPGSISDDFINTVYEDNDGDIWVGTKKGVSRYNMASDNFVHFDNQFKSDSILSIQQDEKGVFWIGSYGGGLDRIRFDNQKNRVIDRVNFTIDANDPTALTGDAIYSLLIDNSHILWVGTYAGINKLDLKPKKFKLIRKTERKDSPNLSSNFIASVYRDKQGILWLGSWGQGLSLLNEKTGRVVYYSPSYKGKHAIVDGNVHVIFEDSNDRVWIGTRNGIQVFSARDSSFIDLGKYININGLPDFKKVRIRKIFEDTQNNVWVCTDNGLFKLDIRKGKVQSFFSGASGLSDNLVYDILEDSDGWFWIGTSNGLNRYNFRTGDIIYYKSDPKEKNSLSNNMVLCLLLDHRGDLWLGTSHGLNLLKKGASHFIKYSKSDGLPNDYIYNIVEDKSNRLWFSTNGGLGVLNLQTNKIETYTHEDGLQALEFNGGAYFKTDHGDLYFGGPGGLNKFNPDSMTVNQFIPPIVITSVERSNESGKFKEAVRDEGTIEVAFNDFQLAIEFAALDYTNSKKNQFTYQMSGLSEAWINVGNRNYVSFTNLPPGKYKFSVRGTNNDGIWNMKGASVSILIHPPWWKSLPFYTSSVVFFVIAIFLYIKIRERNLKAAKIFLEGVVRERTNLVLEQKERLEHQNEELRQGREEVSAQRDMMALQYEDLQRAHQIIEQQNEEIKKQNENLGTEVENRTHELVEYNQQLEQFAYISAHNLRAPVARVLGLGQLIELAENDPAERKIAFDKLIFTTHELDRVVRDLSTILEIKKNGTSVLTEINLDEEFQMVKINLEKEIAETTAIIEIDFSEVNVIHTVKPYLDSILFNLVGNAIKYRHPDRPPRINIKTEIKEGQICLSIKDNGLGIDLALHRDKIFTLYKRFHSHVEGKGLGLYLVKTQVIAMGGRIEVESEKDIGTTFYVDIPSQNLEK